MTLLAGSAKVAPAVLPSCPVLVPGVPHSVGVVPEVAGSPAVRVFFVYGERTVMLPLALKVIFVGPV